jgi:hypothetical protein
MQAKVVVPYLLAGVLICFGLGAAVSGADSGSTLLYVGSQVCAECHPDEYARFKAHSKKSKSYTSIERMAGKLTTAERNECYQCHTTGYGKPGGFRSLQETPELKNTGCEVCHGPGSLHVETEDPSDLIQEISIEKCKSCHNDQRVAAFRFKPLIFGGAH